MPTISLAYRICVPDARFRVSSTRSMLFAGWTYRLGPQGSHALCACRESKDLVGNRSLLRRPFLLQKPI